MSTTINFTTAMLGFVIVISGCSGSAGGNNSTDNADVQNNFNDQGLGGIASMSGSESISIAQDLVGEVPAGSVTSYGAISVGDDAGMASDVVAAFFEVEEGVSAEFLAKVFDGQQTLCTVDDDDSVDFEEISVGFIPSFNGVNKKAISAGESIVITSDAGTFATIQSQSAGSFLFYTLPDMQVLPVGPLPQMLQVDIIGDVYPSYQAAMMPTVSTLVNVNYGSETTITPKTTFTWSPSVDSGSLIRIFASTVGGFFVEDGVTVTCLTPDTGSFSFPASVQADLGASFIGTAPIMSRIAVRTEATDNSVLFLIRESFAN